MAGGVRSRVQVEGGMWRRVSMTVWCGGGEAGSRLWQGGVAHVAQQSLLLIIFFVAT